MLRPVLSAGHMLEKREVGNEGISGWEVNEVGFDDWGDALKKRLFLQDSLGLLQAGSYFYTVPAIIYMSYANHISYEPILLIWQKA